LWSHDGSNIVIQLPKFLLPLPDFIYSLEDASYNSFACR
jgi:hypothetical protein